MKFSKGWLSDTNFIEILKDASQSGLTGVIRVENGPVIKVIYFQKGSISFASSNEKSDRLTEVLKRAGKLTPEQVADAQSRLKPNVSLGKTLVELGYMSAKDLLWGARAQVDGILHQLLFWNQGKYQILEGALPREIIHLNLSVSAVIFEGIMKTQNRDWVLQHIGSPEAIYAIASDYEERSRDYKLPVSTVATKLNGRRSLHDIAQSSGIDSFELCKTVVALEYLDLARPIQDEPLQMALNTPETDQPFDLSVDDQPVPTEVERTPEFASADEIAEQEPFQMTEPGERPAQEEPEPATISPATTVVTEPEPQANTGEVTQAEQEQAEEVFTVTRADSTTDSVETTVKEDPAIVPLIPVEVEDNPSEFKKYMEHRPAAISATKRSTNWKAISLFLFAVAAVAAGWLYYSATVKVPVYETADKPSSRLQPPPQAESTPADTPDSTPAINASTTDAEAAPVDSLRSDSVENSPIDLVRAGKIADAAEFWRQDLAGNRNGYSIQVVIACQDRTVIDTFETLSYSSDLIILPMVFKGQNCYRLLFGQYPSRQLAAAAIQELPDVFLRQRSPASVVAFSKVLS